MHFTEDFLHYLWRFRLFTNQYLHCTSGERLEIINTGVLNKDAGPDFNQAKIKIGDTIWAGNVEIHLCSSDWFLHNHQKDTVYDSIILHVVFKDDMPVNRKDGSLIPTFVVENLFPNHLLNNYTSLINNLNYFPCERQVHTVDNIFINGLLARTMSERLEEKSADIYLKLEVSNGNWDQVFYLYVAKSFGFKVNSLPFELMASSLPYRLLAKHRDQPHQVEALIFGQAGFLQQPCKEEYPRKLQREYRFLKKKYALKPIDASLWKFLRMRPDNFPTIRLAQFSALMVRSSHLFSSLMDGRDVKSMQAVFEDLIIDPYWDNHYHFGKVAAVKHHILGLRSIQNIIINTVCIFLYAYGRYLNNEHLMERSLKSLEKLPPESNSIVDKYKSAGIDVINAFTSQSILQLNKNYCSQKKCLNCVIGLKILNKE
jgi:hypothetical protein